MSRSENQVRMGLRWKIVGLTSGSMLLVALILVFAYNYQSRTIVEEQLRERARAVALGLANNLAFAAFSGDRAGLQSAADGTLRDLPGIGYVLLRGRGDEALAEAVHAAIGAASPDSIGKPDRVDSGHAAERSIAVGGVPVVEMSTPIILEHLGPEPGEASGAAEQRGRRVGLVQVAFRADELRSRIAQVTSRSLLLALLIFVPCLAAALLLARLLTGRIEKLERAAAAFAAGDLTRRAEVGGEDEISALGKSFDGMADSLREMLSNLGSAAADVEREASQILSSVTQQSAMATQQASAIQETSSTVSEIAQTSNQATAHADDVIKVAQKSEELSQEGQSVVEQAIQAMEKLGEQVRAIAMRITELSDRTLQIGDIIATVKDLAEQSNMLALNAAIEAAKAGEEGRGFAVVATEMRNLAEQSKVAAGQVRGILEEIHTGTRSAVAATEEGRNRAHAAVALAKSAGGTIEGLAEVIRDSSSAARQIATNTRQQTQGVDQILTAVNELSDAMVHVVAGTQRIEGGTQALSTVSKRLSELVRRYRV